MKKLFLFLLLLPLFSHATILRVGTDGYVTIDGQNYQRTGSSTYYLFRTSDSTVQLSLFGAGKIAGQPYTAFYDGDNGDAQFTSMAALQTWLNAHFEPVGPSTLTLTTTGSSGAATLSNDTLNIPQYSGGGGSADSTTFPTQYQLDTAKTNLRADAIYYTQVSLSSAQLLSLNTTPVQLVAAPGAGKYIVPIHMSFDYTYGTATYSTVTIQTYETSDKSGPITSNSSFLSFTASIIRQLYTTGAAGGGIITYAANQPLMIYATTEPTTGDGTAKVNVYYKIVTQ